MSRVQFSTERSGSKCIRWNLSRRLVQGTILAVSTTRDAFRSIVKVATVGDRPVKGGLDQCPPTVDIVWADIGEAVFDPDEELIMLEARLGYYEANRHIMTGLQLVASTEYASLAFLVSVMTFLCSAHKSNF